MTEESSWSEFRMKPVQTIEQLARRLVADQVKIAEIRRLAESLPPDVPEAAVEEARQRGLAAVHDWTETALPTLAASFRLALEVLDTYGPQGVSVEDPIEAAAWNNKFFVWRKEFGDTG